MPLPFHLGLRDNQHMVTLIKSPDGSGYSLGIAYPEDTHNRRAHIPNQWGVDAQSPRRPVEGTINQPISPRAQAILSYQVGHTEQAILNRQALPQTQSRLDNQAGPKRRMHLGVDHAVIPVESRRSGFGPARHNQPGLQDSATSTRASRARR